MIKINILYWDSSDKQRLDNTNLSWLYLTKFTDYCVDQGLQVEPFLFDLSEERVLDNAIHIPFDKGSYRRSEKINRVIDYHGEGDYFFSVMDSDLIIREEDYEPLCYLLKRLKYKNFYVFNLNDLISLNGIDYNNKRINFKELQYTQRKMEPDMGAFFFIDVKEIKKVGGFDERFICWGGEDNIISKLLVKNGLKKIVLPITPIHLPHKNLRDEVINTEQYKVQVDIYNSI